MASNKSLDELAMIKRARTGIATILIVIGIALLYINYEWLLLFFKNLLQ
jgi:hypothetical protein